MKSPHLTLAQSYWKKHLSPHDLAIDATCGNGHDTLFLSHLCHVMGLDIQEAAIANTGALLAKEGKKAELHLRSHDEIDQIPLQARPKLVVYNLGYLPSGDKSLTTQVDSTLESVKKSLELIQTGGAISITCYPGHAEGEKEERALITFLETLPSHLWTICHHRWLNRIKAPSLIWIIKL